MTRLATVAWLLLCLPVLGEDYYYDSNVVGGSNDGSSWENAWNDPNDLPASLSPDDRLYLNASFDNPIRSNEDMPDDTIVELDAGSHFNIYCNQGPDGECWIRNAWLTTWTDEGGGVFSYTTDEPIYVVYDFKQDDAIGTVTGCDYTRYQVASRVARWGLDVENLIPYYGFLEDAGATSTPSDGEWGYTGGTLYVNPPGSPDNATVNSLAEIIDESRDALELNACTDFTLHPGLRTILTPGESGDNDGYSVRGNGCTRGTLKGVISYCSGQHGPSFAGAAPDSSSGHSNRLIDIISVGCHGDVGTVGNPYVFYTSSGGDTDTANYLGYNLVAINIPMFKTDGAPLNDVATNGVMFQSHSDGGVDDLGPVTWRRCLGIDFLEQIDAKHSSSLSSYGDAMQGKQIDPPSDPNDESEYLVRMYDSTFVGHLVPTDTGSHYYERVTWDNSGTGSTGLAPWNGTVDACNVYMKDCIWISGEVPNQIVTNIGSNDHWTLKDTKLLDNSTTSNKDGWFYVTTATGTNLVVLENVSLDHSDPNAAERSLFKANPTAWNDDLSVVTSRGGVVLGDGMAGWVFHTNTGGVPNPRDLAYWQLFIGDGTDDEAAVSIDSLDIPTGFFKEVFGNKPLAPLGVQ